MSALSSTLRGAGSAVQRKSSVFPAPLSPALSAALRRPSLLMTHAHFMLMLLASSHGGGSMLIPRLSFDDMYPILLSYTSWASNGRSATSQQVLTEFYFKRPVQRKMKKLPGIDLFSLRLYVGQEGGRDVRFSLSAGWQAAAGLDMNSPTTEAGGERCQRHWNG